MKRSILAAALALAVVSPTAFTDLGQGGIALQCSSSSVDQFGPMQGGGQVKNQPDPTTALTFSMEGCISSLVGHSGVTCGPCENPESCQAAPTNMSAEFSILGPHEVTPGKWWCRVTFEGTYHITCGACEN